MVLLFQIQLLHKKSFTYPQTSSDMHSRVRIGYVSSDFCNHPTAHLMQSIPGLHNRERVEIFCYSLSADDGTTFRAKIQREAEHFVDLSSTTCNEQAVSAHRDVLVRSSTIGESNE